MDFYGRLAAESSLLLHTNIFIFVRAKAVYEMECSLSGHTAGEGRLGYE